MRPAPCPLSVRTAPPHDRFVRRPVHSSVRLRAKLRSAFGARVPTRPKTFARPTWPGLVFPSDPKQLPSQLGQAWSWRFYYRRACFNHWFEQLCLRFVDLLKICNYNVVRSFVSSDPKQLSSQLGQGWSWYFHYRRGCFNHLFEQLCLRFMYFGGGLRVV